MAFYYNPVPRTQKRISNVKLEINLAIKQLLTGSISTCFFYWQLRPLTKYYNYYKTHQFGVKEFIFEAFLYQFVIKFLEYWIHRMFHTRFFFKYIHKVHHQFSEPSAFGCFAAHPLEGVIEGVIPRHIFEFILPLHPINQLVFGFIRMLNSIGWHDGSYFDFEDHYRHHMYADCNFTPLFFDKLFGTAYKSENYPHKKQSIYLKEKFGEIT